MAQASLVFYFPSAGKQVCSTTPCIEMFVEEASRVNLSTSSRKRWD